MDTRSPEKIESTSPFSKEKSREVSKNSGTGESKNVKYLSSNILKSLIKSRQDISVSGQVTSQQGDPLPGVNVVVQGTTEGTVTDVNGQYSLQADENATLVFSFVGYLTQEVDVNGRSTIDISLPQDISELEEVVVVGYGTQEKRDVTGSVARANLESFDESGNTNIFQSLQGAVPGLQVGQVSSAGEEPSMIMRGKSTLSGAQDPLVVVDGVIFRGNLNDINPSNIESVDILKDASAAAIYGSQATNGVIMITTTTGGGKDGKPTLKYNSFFSLRNPVRELPTPDPQGFYEQTALSDITFSRTEASGYLEPNPDWEITNRFSVNEEVSAYRDGRTTNWYDKLTNDQMYTQEHNISMANSTENNKYLASIGYNEQKGYMLN